MRRVTLDDGSWADVDELTWEQYFAGSPAVEKQRITPQVLLATNPRKSDAGVPRKPNLRQPSNDRRLKKGGVMELDPMELLDEMIARGWGDVQREQIPDDWREQTPPATAAAESRTRYYIGASERRERHAAKMRARGRNSYYKGRGTRAS